MLERDIQDWIAGLTGAQVVRVERLFSGGSRHTILVDALAENGTELPLVLRRETGAGSHAGTDFSLEREYTVYRALAGSGIPVPKAYGLSTDKNALLLQRVPGTSDFRAADAQELSACAKSFMTSLAALHRLDIDTLDLPGFARPRTAEENALLELDRWEALARERTHNDVPLVRYALSWLRRHAPRTVQRTVLVQSDTGPGNFVAQAGQVSGIIDWEFSHLGDPMMDIAWVQFRAARTPLAAPLKACYPLYESLSGLKIEPASVRYYVIFVLIVNAITTEMAIFKDGGAMGSTNYLGVHQTVLQRLSEALLDQLSLPIEPVSLPPSATTSRTALFDRLLHDLKERVRPGVKVTEAKVALNGVQALVGHLKLHDQFGDAVAAADAADQKTTFGRTLRDAELNALADEAGARADQIVLRYLARQCGRNTQLWPPPMPYR